MNSWRHAHDAGSLRVHPGDDAAGRFRAAAGDVLSIASYILQQNGAAAGAQALTPTTAVPIGTIATGQRPAAGAAAAARRARRAARDADKARAAEDKAQAAGGGPRRNPEDGRPRRSRTGSGAGAARAHRDRRSEELRPGHRRDAAQSAARRLADGAPQLPGLELQPAQRDHARQRQGPEARVGLGDARQGGANQKMPLVHNGIIYLVNPGNVIQALDGSTGELIWENEVGPLTQIGMGSMRNVAIYEDKLIFATTDARLVALDARNGKQVWETAIADRTKGFSNTSGPIVARGKVIQGLQGCARYGPDRCFISAYDAATGKQLWKFYTIAHAGEPGGDSWGKLPDNFRKGGETWIAGSYDPDLNLTYWGIAQAKPWMPASRGNSIFDAALYAASTVALNVDDGKLAWHFQDIPGESLDLDEVYERVLVDIGADKFVFTIGKSGILWKVDRRNGKFVGAKETVFQNVYDRIDPKTGLITYRADIVEQQVETWIQSCPSTEGGHNWQAMSYHPPTSSLIIPLSQSCMEMSGRKTELKEGAGGTNADRRFFEMPGSDGNVGKLAAYDVGDDEGAVELSAARRVPDRRCCRRPAASRSSAISIAFSARSTRRPAPFSGRRGSARRCRDSRCRSRRAANSTSP